MEKRVILAVAICIGILAAWQKFYIQPIMDAQNQFKQTHPEVSVNNKTESGVVSTQSTSNTKIDVAKADSTKVAQQDVVLANDKIQITLSNAGAIIKNIVIQKYNGQSTDHVFQMIGREQQLALSTNSPEFPNFNELNFQVEKTNNKVTMNYRDAKVSISKEFFLNNDSLEVKQNLEFFSGQVPTLASLELSTKQDIGKVENEKRQILVGVGTSMESFQVDGFSDTKEAAADAEWIGLSSRYFLNAVSVNSDVKPNYQVKKKDDGNIHAALVYKVVGNKISIPVKYYYGPKEMNALKAVNTKILSAVDFGWFTFFAHPLLQGLKWIYNYVHNFGIAIILLTILVKLLTYPLTYKSMKSMKEMQRIQPQINKLRDKYGDDKEKLNQEMITLMRNHGYNPLSGCFPMLIQMPIFIALYNVLFNSIELYGQPFFGWIHDLSQKDPYFVTPVLLALVMFIQQKLTPNTATDPAQQKMMTMMPLIFGAMMVFLPSGLTLYMLVNSVVSIIQQMMINRSFARVGLA